MRRRGAKVVLVGLVLAVAAACSSYGEDAGPTTTTTDGGRVESGAMVGPEAGAADGGADAGDSGVGGLDCTGTLVCDDFERDGLATFGWERLENADAPESTSARVDDPDAPSPKRVFEIKVPSAPTACAYDGLKATRNLSFGSLRLELHTKVLSASAGEATLAYLWFASGGKDEELYLHLKDGALHLYQQANGASTGLPFADLGVGGPYQRLIVAIDFVKKQVTVSGSTVEKTTDLLATDLGPKMDSLIFGLGSFCSKSAVTARFDDVTLRAE